MTEGREVREAEEAHEAGGEMEEMRREIRQRYEKGEVEDGQKPSVEPDVRGDGMPTTEVAEAKPQREPAGEQAAKPEAESMIEQPDERSELERFREQASEQYPDWEQGPKTETEPASDKAGENLGASGFRYENEEELMVDEEEKRRALEEDDDPKAVDSRRARADGREERNGGDDKGRTDIKEMARPGKEPEEGSEKRIEKPVRPADGVKIGKIPGEQDERQKDSQEDTNSTEPRREREQAPPPAEGHAELKESEKSAAVRGDDPRPGKVLGGPEAANSTKTDQAEKGEVQERYIAEYEATARSVPRKNGSNIRFDIEKSSLERDAGITFRDNKTYEIEGKAGDVEFKSIHSRNEGRRLYITIPPEEADKFEVERRYPVKIRSIEEKRTFTPFEGKEGQVWLQLQKAALDSVGIDQTALEGKDSQDRIAELKLRNLSREGEPSKIFFSQVSPTDGVTLKLARAGVEKNDKLELQGGRLYKLEHFIHDFEAHKGKELENISLRMSGEKLLMKVDGRDHELKDRKMDADGLRFFLKAKIEGYKDDIRFIYDGSEGKIVAKTGGGRDITGFVSSEQHGLAIRYSEKNPPIFIPFKERFESERWNQRQFEENISLRGANKSEGLYRFEISDSLQKYMQERLDQLKPYGKIRNTEIGRIGEDIGTTILIEAGLPLLERHPFDEKGPGPEYNKHRTDSLHLQEALNELYLFEFRYWKHSKEGSEKAFLNVLDRLEIEGEHPRYGKINGAYIAALSIDMETRIGKLRVERVW